MVVGCVVVWVGFLLVCLFVWVVMFSCLVVFIDCWRFIDAVWTWVLAFVVLGFVWAFFVVWFVGFDLLPCGWFVLRWLSVCWVFVFCCV